MHTYREYSDKDYQRTTHATVQITSILLLIIIIIILIIFVYSSCSQNATTEPKAVMQDSTDTTECTASIYNQTTQD